MVQEMLQGMFVFWQVRGHVFLIDLLGFSACIRLCRAIEGSGAKGLVQGSTVYIEWHKARTTQHATNTILYRSTTPLRRVKL